MSDYYIGEIRLFSYLKDLKHLSDWLPCDGRILQVKEYIPLFSVIGNRFGGDGKVDFALPDLQGRVAVFPQIANSQRIKLSVGQTLGEESHTLLDSEVPNHIHQAQASKGAGTSNAVAGNVWAAGAKGKNLYGALSSLPVKMNAAIVTPSGGGTVHDNMQPFLVLNYCIAISGTFPPRN